MKFRMNAVLALVIWVACLAPGLPTPASAQQIGLVASITPQMRGQAPGAATRVLRAGSAVVANQRISTGASGRGQLLFNDETTLSVATRSEVVLDRFIYDPNRGAGDVGLSLTRGALRFIGGKATEKKPARIQTPTGTISIRGSSALVLVQDGLTYVVFVAGERLCFAVSGGKRHCTNRRGGMLGDSGYLGKVSGENLARILARIDGPAVANRSSNRAGSGIARQNPSNRDPLSTTGESYDNTGPDAPFGTDATEGLLGSDVLGGEDEPVVEDDPIVEDEPVDEDPVVEDDPFVDEDIDAV